MKKRLLSLLLVLLMVCALLPNMAFAAGGSVEVSFSAQNMNIFMLPLTNSSVSATLAEEYGFTDSVPGSQSASALDVLVKANIMYAAGAGDTLTAANISDYLVVSPSGSITKMFALESSSSAAPYGFSFSVNMAYPMDASGNGYMINTAPVEDGDTVEFYCVQDSYWLDSLAWFASSDAATDKLTQLTVAKNENVTLNVQGYCYGWYGYLGEGALRTNGQLAGIEDVQICTVAAAGTDVVPDDITGKITDENGDVTLSFDAAGTYYLTGYDSTDYAPIYSPWLKVVVVENALTAQDYVDAAVANLAWADVKGANTARTAVTENLALPASVYPNTGITWSSPDEDYTYFSVYGSDGYVTRPSQVTGAKSYTLRATITDTLTATPTASAVVDFSITLKPAGQDTDNQRAATDFYTLMNGIAAKYAADKSEDAWVVMDMAAYGSSEAANASYGTALAALSGASSAGDVSKFALAEHALGNAAAFNTASGYLSNVTSAYYSAIPFALSVQQLASSADEASTAQYLRETNAVSTGGWGYSSYSADVDVTAMVIAALAPYYNTDSAVKTAVDKALTYLSGAQQSNGSWNNANSTAMVVTALSALGIDAHTDARFIKSYKSAVEGLLYYALEDNTGFGYTGNTLKNAMATEQGFRALVAYARYKESGAAYNIYIDASAQDDAPADPHITATTAPYIPQPTGKVNVTFTMRGDTAHGAGNHTAYTTWIAPAAKQLDAGKTVADLIALVAAEKGYTCAGLSSGYLTSVTSPSGVTLGELTNGANSGWMYTVNGKIDMQGMQNCVLADGDSVTLMYVDDFTTETEWDENTGEDEPDKVEFDDVKLADWFYDEVMQAVKLGLFEGTGDKKFDPLSPMKREQFITVLWRMAGEPAAETQNGVPAGQYYTEALSWAIEKGILKGDGAGYGIGGELKREQFITLLYRYASLTGLDTAASGELDAGDAAAVSDWAKDAVVWGIDKKIMQGAYGLLTPQNAATRAEGCAMLLRLEKI